MLLPLTSVKSRKPFWYQLTQVATEKRLLNMSYDFHGFFELRNYKYAKAKILKSIPYTLLSENIFETCKQPDGDSNTLHPN